MASDSPATSLPGWARTLTRRVHRPGKDPALGVPADSQWAPPYDDESIPYAPIPEPWPPAPPALPARPESDQPGGDRATGPAATPEKRRGRTIALGAAAVCIAAWVGVAAFIAPVSGKTKTNGSLSSGPSSAFPQTPNRSGGIYRGATGGIVQSVDGLTLSLLDRNGQSVTVHTTASTAFVKILRVSVGQLKTGDTISASGVYSGVNGTLVAGRIAIVASGPTTLGPGRSFSGGQGNSATGRVGAIDDDHLSLEQFDGTELNVVISPSATVTAPVPATLRDMARGDSITVRGSVAADGDIVAYQVQEAPSAGYFGPSGFGRNPSRSAQSGSSSGSVVES